MSGKPGRITTDATRAAISAAMSGKTQTAEHVSARAAAIRETHRRKQAAKVAARLADLDRQKAQGQYL